MNSDNIKKEIEQIGPSLNHIRSNVIAPELRQESVDKIKDYVLKEISISNITPWYKKSWFHIAATIALLLATTTLFPKIEGKNSSKQAMILLDKNLEALSDEALISIIENDLETYENIDALIYEDETDLY